MPNRKIKGITVAIGGDTTGLNKALQSVNKEIKDTQSQLKDVEKLLKLDPGNTELLMQKHKLLGESVEETKNKLSTLKTAAEQANEALSRGDISQEQYDALQREIAEAEQALKALEKQAGQSSTAIQKIAAAGEKLKSTGDAVASAGKKMLPVTAAVTGLGTAAVKTAADFDTAMSKVAAVSGAAGDDLDALRDKAREMGAKTKFSASEAAEAMNYMAMAGWKTSDMLSGIEGIMNLAAVSGESLGTTSDIVTDALSAFGLTAADSSHFADVLAAASSNANTNVSMMGETFKYCAPVAGALGYSVDDVAEAIGLMANSGIKASQAGTSLRTIMTSLQGNLLLTGDAFGEMEIETSNADGTMRDFTDILADCRSAFSRMSESEAASTAEAIVGKNAMSGFLALMNAAPADIEKLSASIAACDGTSQSMADTMQDNLEGQMTILKSQLEELAISFGDLLMPIIRDIVGHIQNFVNKLNGMDAGTRKVILTIAAAAAAVDPVLIMIGKVISSVGTILTVIPKLSGALKAVKGVFAGLNAVMAANPIVLIIAAIAALVAAFIYLWNNCEGFRQFWIDLWEGIKTVVSTSVDAVKKFFSGVIDFVKENWQGLLLLLVNPIAGAFKLLYDKRFMLLQPVLNTELNTAGSFTFTMPPSHYFYDSLRLLTSTVEVYEDGELLWYGRPVEIRSDFLRQKQVYCEGAFSFFNDTVQRPQEYESVFLRTFFRNVIAAHNSQTDISRRFQVGTVTVPNVQVYRKLEYASTFETLKKLCLEADGGYFFFRRENGVNYIDWLAEMPYTCGQPVEFGLNLLDLNSSLSGADIVTCLLPYADGEEGTLTVTSVNDGSDVIESEAAETYGRIARAVKFDKVTSASELLALGTEYLENTQFDALTVECSAVELHLRNPGYEQFRVGQTVHCRSVPHLVDRDFPLVKMELRLDNASKQITLGTAKRQALTRIFREDAGNATTEEIGEVKDEIGGQIEEIQQDISDINTRLDAADSAGWKHWYGTANEYNRISNYDARTIYFIRSTENMADYFQYETEETP